MALSIALLAWTVPALAAPGDAFADAVAPLAGATGVGAAAGDFSVKTQILLFMTLLGLLPALVMVMTCFMRFVIVLSLLRQALGLQQGLPARLITGIALMLTLLVMRPVADRVWQDAVLPFDRNEIGFQEAVKRAEQPLARFMLAQTNKAALAQIARLAGEGEVTSPERYSFVVKASAFLLSELKTAFQIGSLLFLPFLIIDLVVSSVLMAMGMMMLSPLVISLPLKLLLFVMVDGWSLTVNTLTASIQAY
ncbi:flagellar type III secretion system pore protein FliP [Chitinasiproducens palmae]|uniref:flagellar type III secretion system pore protein FliP n=1 Tax=Chitinasiproducens palmae TaxID=1770053 RepID=UPI000B870482|nr:flagellar type III secretion system pore protein FliP [Chitinasiproducens palmae]